MDKTYVNEHKLEMFLLTAKANYKEIINLINETAVKNKN